MNEEVNYMYWNIFVIGLYILLFVVLTFMVQFYFRRKEYATNFEKYRCQPRFLFFTSWLNKNESVSDNFEYCLQRLIKPRLKEETDNRLTDQAETLGRLVKENAVNTEAMKKETRKTQEDTRNKMNTIQKTFDKVENVSYYMVLKIQNFLSKIGATIVAYYYQLITSVNLVLIGIAQIYRMVVMNFIYANILFTLNYLSPLLFPVWPYKITGDILTGVNTGLAVSKKVAQKRRFCSK